MPPEQSSQQSSSGKSSSPLFAIIAVLVIAILAFFGYRVMKKPAEDMASDTPTPTPSVPTEPSTQETTPAGQKYVDGTYTATGSYAIPNGKKEEITVTLTLAGNVVTDVSYTSVPLEKGSEVNQAKFSAGYKAEVVGKNIDEINLTVVNGSSLTPIGFMDALAKIKSEAAPAPQAI